MTDTQTEPALETEGSETTQRRCADCKAHNCADCDGWYDAKLSSCPCCGLEVEANAAVTKAAHASKVNEHLFAMAGQAREQQVLERRLRSGPNRRGGSPLDRPPSSFQG